MSEREGTVVLLTALLATSAVLALVAFSHGRVSLLWLVVVIVALFAGFMAYERIIKHRY